MAGYRFSQSRWAYLALQCAQQHPYQRHANLALTQFRRASRCRYRAGMSPSDFIVDLQPSLCVPVAIESWEPPRDTGLPSRERFPVEQMACTWYEDPTALTVRRADWSMEATQLNPGHFRATSFWIPLGSLLVSGGTCNLPVILRAQPPRGCISIVLAESTTDSFFVQGRKVLPDQCVLVGGDAALELLSSTPLDVVVISVSEAAWQAQCSDQDCVSSGIQVRAPGARWSRQLREIVRSLRAELASEAATALAWEARTHGSAALLACLRELPAADIPLDPHGRTDTRRAMTVERARRYIDRNLAGPLRVSTVCDHTGAQGRTLEYGFREMLGIPPVSYIKALRLNRVHRLLRSAEAERHTITEVALDCGFWHLSQFAADYQKFFGESPSRSRRRAIFEHGSPLTRALRRSRQVMDLSSGE